LRDPPAAGELERRGAAEKIGASLGLSRSNIYYYLRKKPRGKRSPNRRNAG
jgi:predicted transcriptional regulator YheO